MSDIRPGAYRHFKGGRYEVLGVARHSETEEPHVVYRSADGSWWIRPAAMFAQTVEHDGRMVPRFAPVSDTGDETSAS